MTTLKNALNEYKQVDVQGGIESASPHRLIQMLINGALEKIVAAKGFMQRNEIAAKGEHISRAISIIDGLRASLDQTLGNELVQNLDALYLYMGQKLLQANIEDNIELLDEVHGLMFEIKVGWDGIENEAANLEQAKQQQAQTGT